MSYAIVQTGGKQYRVEPGRFYDIELLPGNPGDTLTITDILLVNLEGNVSVGRPLVEGAKVEATLLEGIRAKKIIVYKMRPKKKTRKKTGHRQRFTRLLVNSISYNGVTVSDSALEEAPVFAPSESAVTEVETVETAVAIVSESQE